MLGYACAASLSLAAVFLAHRWSGRFGFGSDPDPGPAVRLLSRSELSLFTGEEGSDGLFLAILGQVFDVREGRRHYGPGGAYHFMAGKDASLAFITGDFTGRGVADDVSSLTPLQVVALYEWLDFYQRDYRPVGLVIGRFYSETGGPTETLLQTRASLEEGRRIKAQSHLEKSRLPPCNSEWSAARGGRVWCSTKSGGVERGWTGVPRKLFSPGSSGVRCVCVEDPSAAERDPNLQRYDGCHPRGDSCAVADD
ncbi:neuferricin [Brachionichthys hirsutus]|uniref:neuferricin n=1 Tax=Brachionichthys hirsutus TaxID=412623 RepID=UPI003604BFD0